MTMRISRVILSVCLCINSLSPSLPADCSQQRTVTSFGKLDTTIRRLDPTHPQSFIPESDARYLRARLVVDTPSNCAWSLTIRDQYLHPVQTLAASDFQATSVSWTSRVYGPKLTIELHTCAGNAGPSLTVNRVIWMPSTVRLGPNAFYSLKSFDGPDWKELYEESSIRTTDPQRVETGDAVGILVLSTENGAWSCSGFMVTDTLFLTNWHCGANEDQAPPQEDYWNKEIVHDAIIDLSWDTNGISREFLVSSVEQADINLDFAILRVRPVGTPSPVNIGILADWLPAPGDTLYTIHHPLGMRKTYSGSCNARTVPFPNWKQPPRSTDFTHDCDTEAGSSGAPLFNTTGEIVGVHHLPYDFDGACRVTSENKGISTHEILAVLKPELKTGLTIHEKQ
jgi:hypothetical protein